MNIDEARKRVDDILRLGVEVGDDEAAHGRDDILRAEFLRHVAVAGPHDLAAIAGELLRTEGQFSRWAA